MAPDDDRASAPEHTPDAPPSRTDTDRTAAASDVTDEAAYAWLDDDLRPHTYLAIRPTDTPLDHAAVRTAMRRLAATLRDREASGLTATLTRSRLVPRVEVLLVADGTPDTGLQYLVGTRPPGETDKLRGVVRDVLQTALPNDTELTETQFHPLEPRRYCDPPIGEHAARVNERVDASENSAGRDGGRSDGGPADTGDEDASPAPDEPLPDAAEPYVAGVEYVAHARDRRDWQTPLTPFADLVGDTARSTDTRVPLASVAEALADAAVPAVYQTVVRAHRDWATDAERYVDDLAGETTSLVSSLGGLVVPRRPDASRTFSPSRTDQRRIEGISARDPRETVVVSARAVALTRGDHRAADDLAERLSTAFAPVSGEFHEIRGHVRRNSDRSVAGRALASLPLRDGRRPGTQVYAKLIGGAAHAPSYTTPRAFVPLTTIRSHGIVVDPTELPAFCVAGGSELPPASTRSLDTQRPARTGLALPPPGQLARYRGAGWPLGRPVDADRTVDDEPLVLPPHLQPLHLLVVGATGAGKSTTLTTGMLANHEVTDGPAILFDAKGGGMARDYLRAHYAKYGHLEDVLYFDCTDVLPALGVFDIRPLLDAGVSREEARSRVAGHYEEMLSGVMGAERFGSAVRSPKVIETHLRALFDPVHGEDAVSHRDLVDALRRTQRDGEPPAVTDDSLDAHFQSLLDSEPRVFSRVLGGALSRVETIATDGRLAPLFDHVPEWDDSETDTADDATTSDDAAADDDALFDHGPTRDDDQDSGHETVGYPTTDHTRADPRFSCTDLLDDDRVVVVDFGGMEDSVKDTLTLVLLAELWTALKARSERTDGGEADSDQSLVNLYLEDAGSVANTDLVDTLLSQGRSFGLSVTLGVQYPGQLETSDPERDTYHEVLNETGTMLVGSVGVDDGLARVLATTELPPDTIARRLGSLERGEWLCRPAAGFGETRPAPFLVESLDPPAGHPASDERVTDAQFQAAVDRCAARTAEQYGLRQAEVSGVDGGGEPATGDVPTQEELDARPPRSDLTTTLPHTQRMPSCVTYVESAGALRCAVCETRYDPSDEGMHRAVECCRGLANVDRDEIPVVQANLKLRPQAVVESEWSLRQLLFLQVVHNAQQGRYSAPGYDIAYDSMVRLREYVGVDTDDVLALKEAGLLVEDGDHPHLLYSVTSDGRAVIAEGRREGLDYGDGAGDLTESSQHRLAVEVGRRYLHREYVRGPSDVVWAKPYHEVEVDGERRRLDCAGVDAEGNVVVALEAERINNDVAQAVPADFDTMAACDPVEAIWVVLTRSAGHTVVAALADPPDGEPRVEKTYSETTPLRDVTVDTPGFTAVHTVSALRDTGSGWGE